jgi:3',5'-cyclic-nucleotide phosphodiesterase
MRMRVLGCSGGSAPARLLSGYLFDDVFAVDAGSLTTALELEAQRRVDAVALTHAHLDHVGTLPFFLANRYGTGAPTFQVYADAATLRSVKESLFNDRVWPDFSQIRHNGSSAMEFRTLEPGKPTQVLERYEVTAVTVDHTVPTVAFLVRSGRSSALVCGDTTTTRAIWDLSNATDDLRGIVIECSFPNEMEPLAKVSGHLTPAMFAAELKKLTRDVPVYVTHIKPEHRLRVIDELRSLRERRLRILEDGQLLEF